MADTAIEIELVAVERHRRNDSYRRGRPPVPHREVESNRSDRLWRWITLWATRLGSLDLDGLVHPMDVTRRVRLPAAEANDLLNRSLSVTWGGGRHSRRLSFEPLLRDAHALGVPWMAAGTIRGRRARALAVSIAIFDGGPNRCVVQIRPAYRTPWGIRRRRRCLSATHDAADRVVDLLLAVDYTPPPEWTFENASSGGEPPPSPLLASDPDRDVVGGRR